MGWRRFFLGHSEKANMRFEEELVELLPRLRRFARGLTRHQSDADDLCQAAIERALKSRDQWQSGTRLDRSEEHTSELQSLMRISYDVFCLTNKNKKSQSKHKY